MLIPALVHCILPLAPLTCVTAHVAAVESNIIDNSGPLNVTEEHRLKLSSGDAGVGQGRQRFRGHVCYLFS